LKPISQKDRRPVQNPDAAVSQGDRRYLAGAEGTFLIIDSRAPARKFGVNGSMTPGD
jgi:hypothetical protein